jgi:membrane-associated phospholipid phosphatase
MNILYGIFSNYVDFFYSIGYFGEYITFLITCILIFNKHIYLFFYIILFFLNRIINQNLKNYFKEPRPNNPKKFLESDFFSKKKYGMPSGHAQLTFFSIFYAYLVTNTFIPWILFLLIVGLIVIYERFLFKNHTLYQLFSGAIIGIFIAYLSYTIIRYISNYSSLNIKI